MFSLMLCQTDMSGIKSTNRSSVQEMDHHVKRMLKLIEEDADSLTKKVEIYYQKRPELISLVEDVYRMYRSLAERYDQVTGELRKSIPSDLQSQCSGITDLGSEPPSAMPSPGPSRRQSGHRAPGFEYFLGHNGSDLYNKEGDESSMLESESESDDSSVNYYSAMHSNAEEQGLRQKIVLLEVELREVKEKLKLQEESSADAVENSDKLAKEATEAQECNNVSGGEVLDSECRVLTLWEEHRLTREKLQQSEQEVARLRQELTSKLFPLQNLQDQLKLAEKELFEWQNKIEEEREEVTRLENCVAMYKSILTDRDQEIMDLKEAISEERSCLEDNVKQLDRRCQSLEEEKEEMEAAFGFQIEQLKAEIADKNECIEELKIRLHELKLNHDALVDEKDDLNINIFELGKELNSKDDQIDQMNSHLQQLHVEHVGLVAGYEGARRVAEELRLQVKELEREVEKKQEIIDQGAEEKREAIRQLCFSLEHYRNGYHRLREVVSGENAIS